MATLDTDDEDTKRQRTSTKTLEWGLSLIWQWVLLSLLQQLVRLKLVYVNLINWSVKLKARAWLKENEPPKGLEDESPEDVVVRAAIKQEEALDEVGMYNYSLNPDLTQPIKGVHDMYDYTELGVRTVDDYGVVGASIDSARIARNLDTVHGRLGNVISEPALKYSVSTPGAGQDVVLGLADQLHGPIGIGRNWKVTFKDVLDANEDLAIELFDPRMTKSGT